jgi:hypothetical protein
MADKEARLLRGMCSRGHDSVFPLWNASAPDICADLRNTKLDRTQDTLGSCFERRTSITIHQQTGEHGLEIEPSP